MMSPFMLGDQKDVDDVDLDQQRPRRKRSLLKKAGSKHLFGRRSHKQSSISRPSSDLPADSEATETDDNSSNIRLDHAHADHQVDHLIGQVSEWIKEERSKQERRKTRRGKLSGDGALS